MDINGEIVKHEKFGVGTIVESDNDFITVFFHATKEKKKFLYPEAFGQFLELQNKSDSDNNKQAAKETEKTQEGDTEQRRIKNIRGIIKRENIIKTIIGRRKKLKEK